MIIVTYIYHFPIIYTGDKLHIVIIIICDCIVEKPPFMHNYKYLETLILILWSIVTQEGKRILSCNLLAWNLPQFYSYA